MLKVSKKKFPSWDCTRPFNNAKFIVKIDYCSPMLKMLNFKDLIATRCQIYDVYKIGYVYSNIHEDYDSLLDDAGMINAIDHNLEYISNSIDTLIGNSSADPKNLLVCAVCVSNLLYHIGSTKK